MSEHQMSEYNPDLPNRGLAGISRTCSNTASKKDCDFAGNDENHPDGYHYRVRILRYVNIFP